MRRFIFQQLNANRRNLAFVSHFHRSAILEAKKPFKLADVGEGITECEVIKWNVKPATRVQAFDPLCEVQSDKASVEITSPYDGVVGELLVPEGQVAKVGDNLCFIEVDEEDGEQEMDEPDRPENIEERNTPSEDEVVKAHKNFGEDVAGGGPRDLGKDLHPLDPNSARKQPRHADKNIDVLATPSVRHLAKKLGVNLNMIAPGSGKDGRIERQDVEAFAGRADAKPSPNQYQVCSGKLLGEGVVVELGRTRYAMWKAMEQSLKIPQFGYSSYMDLTSIHSMLPTLNAHIPRHMLLNPPPEKPLAVNPAALQEVPGPRPEDVPETAKFTRLTYVPFLLKTLALAMSEWPLFRSSITPGSTTPKEDGGAEPKPTLTIRPHSDISVALSTPTGLYTPTLQDVCSESIYTIASALSHLSALGRRTPCGLGPQELPRAGGTITLSNVGAIGKGEFASPVLVPGGGVAIGAVGRAKWVWDEEKQERRFVVGVSWSADHRVVEGAELAAFVECWRGYVEHPERLIASGV